MLGGLVIFSLFSSFFALRERVILDVDAAAMVGSGFGVDDDLAILHALGASKLHVLGITATFGSADLGSVVADVNLLLSFTQFKHKKSDAPVRVYPGADWGSRNLSRSTEAVEFLSTTLRKYPKDTVTLICLGSLTNLATLIQLYPDVAMRLRATVLAAGREGGLELNLFAHPEATKLVLETPIPKLVIFPSAMTGLVFTPAHIQALENRCCQKTDVRAVCELLPAMKHSSFWHSFLFNRFLSHDRPLREGFYPFSLVALLAFSNASQFEPSREIHMEMILAPSFLEEPELKIYSVLGGEFARRRLFENLVLEAGSPLNADAVFSELITGLCAASHRADSKLGSFAPPPSALGLFGLLVPAWHGVVLFQNFCLVVAFSLLVCVMFLRLLSFSKRKLREKSH